MRDSEAERITNKIARHFKLGKFRVYFYGNSGSARIWSYGKMRLSHNPSLATICHELCHPLCYKRYKKRIRHGTKKWNYQLNRLIEYCRKKNFWKEEIEKWRQPKPIKPEPTKEELRQQRVKLLEERKQKYERRIKLAENRIKKINRQIAGLKRFL